MIVIVNSVLLGAKIIFILAIALVIYNTDDTPNDSVHFAVIGDIGNSIG
jgi:hypothetical protein